MPYRMDFADVAADLRRDAPDRLLELGALDVERVGANGLAVLMPDSIAPHQVAHAFGVGEWSVSPATGRDADSVWILSPFPIHVAGLRIVPAAVEAEAGAIKLIDGAAFGTGLHPTTALCLEALDQEARIARPDSVLDVGTGSGVLALAALMMGVPHACGVDIDDEALRVAKENARINGMADRLRLARGGPEAVAGTWPLVLANIVTASLIEIAPALVRRIGHQGRLIASGISSSLQDEVVDTYRRLGMRSLRAESRNGWVMIVLMATW